VSGSHPPHLLWTIPRRFLEGGLWAQDRAGGSKPTLRVPHNHPRHTKDENPLNECFGAGPKAVTAYSLAGMRPCLCGIAPPRSNPRTGDPLRLVFKNERRQSRGHGLQPCGRASGLAIFLMRPGRTRQAGHISTRHKAVPGSRRPYQGTARSSGSHCSRM
jgi:hypothetical protein